ncbi:MAG TPA: FAD:protein FMN transferase [Kofleriaceae bacterium]|nr:FAD:protein FMN transferase [Kofleriaceae bacterium]
MIRLGHGAIAAALAVLILAASGAARADTTSAAPRKHHFQAQSMGTVVDLTIWTGDGGLAASAARAVFDEFRRLDQLMSSWVPTSDVSRINAAAGRKAVPVSDEVLRVIQLAQTVSRESGGAFDITIGAYRGLWKFDEDLDGSIPDAKAVAARRRLTGWRGVRVDPRRKTVKLKRKGMAITLGGIAKGYAVDRAAAILRDRGLHDFIVQAGGDLYVSGSKGGQKWRVGIRDPRGARDATFALTEIQNRTFSTSGDYERGFVKDGVRYHHILDPRTGRPASRSRSVTVMATDALTADAWSTALFVLGAERGLALLKKHPELQAVFVDQKNQIHLSAGLSLVEGDDIRKQLKAGLDRVILLLKRPTDGP